MALMGPLGLLGLMGQQDEDGIAAGFVYCLTIPHNFKVTTNGRFGADYSATWQL
jgi:hypothetical protein